MIVGSRGGLLVNISVFELIGHDFTLLLDVL